MINELTIASVRLLSGHSRIPDIQCKFHRNNVYTSVFSKHFAASRPQQNERNISGIGLCLQTQAQRKRLSLHATSQRCVLRSSKFTGPGRGGLRDARPAGNVQCRVQWSLRFLYYMLTFILIHDVLNYMYMHGEVLIT